MTFNAGQRITAAELNTNTMQLITSTSLLGTTASVQLPITGAYNYLKVLWRARSSAAVAAQQMYLQINGDTGNNYGWQTNEANAANAVSGTHSTAGVNVIQIATITGASATSSLWFASGEFTVGGASDTTNYKTVSGVGAAFVTATNSYAGTYGGQWQSAAAVTSLTLSPATGSFVTGCVFSVYGLS